MGMTPTPAPTPSEASPPPTPTIGAAPSATPSPWAPVTPAPEPDAGAHPGPSFMPPVPPGPVDGPAPAASSGGSSAWKPVLVIGGILVVLALAAAVAFVATSVLGGSGDSTASAANGMALPSGSGPSNEDPERVWKEANDCSDSEYWCTLAIDDDGVFAVTSDGDDPQLISHDPGSGKELWSKRVDASTSIGLQGGTLLAMSFEDEDGTEISRLDRSDGDEVWSADIGPYSSIVGELPDGSLLFSSSDEPEVTVLAREDGDERWSEDGSFLAACDGTVYLDDDGDVTALDAESGDRQWAAKGSEDQVPDAAACASGGIAVVADATTYDEEDYDEEYDDYEESYALTFYAAGDGEETWSEDLDGDDAGAVLDSSGGLVFVGGAKDLRAFESSSGKEKWTADMDGEDSYAVTQVVGSKLLVAESGAHARLLETSSGKEVESTRIGNGGVLLLADVLISMDDDVTGFDLSSLEKAWSVDADGEDLNGVGVGGGRVFVLDGDALQAFS